MTLVELLVASAVGSIILVAVCLLTLYAARSFAAIINYVGLSSTARLTLDIMSRDIRQAKAVTAYTTNSITLTDFDDMPLTFTYDPTAKTLTRIKNDEEKVLLTGCDELSFSLFQRNPVGGSYDQYPAATLATCKLVQISWSCSRTLLKAKANSQKLLTAKIVIRNV